MVKRSCAVLVVALVLAAGGARAASGLIRIGFSLPKTGLFAASGPSQMNAYELWRQQVNAKGGLTVKGERRKVDFVVYDDQSDPAVAVRIYEKLITDDKVDLLLAPWGTPHHFAVAGVLERYKFPMVGNSAASVRLREIKPGYIWFPTTAIPDRMAAEMTALLRKANVRSVSIETLQLPFSLEMKKYLVPALEKAGIKIAVNQEYPPGIKDMTVMLTAVKDAHPDAILSLSYPEDSVLYLKQAKELGVSAPFQFVLIGPTMDFYSKMFGPAADGLVTVGHWSPHQKKWPRAEMFFRAYVDTYKERPDYLDSALAYMSCEILEQAVAKAGLDKAKLRDAIANGTFETINGPVRFKGVENEITPTGFLQLQGGEAQLIWPASMATSAYKPKAPWSAK